MRNRCGRQAAALGLEGERGADGDAQVAHGGVDEEALHLGQVPERLVDQHVGEHTAGEDEVLVARLAKGAAHVGDEHVLQPLLRGGGDVGGGQARELGAGAPAPRSLEIGGEAKIGVVAIEAEEALDQRVGPARVAVRGEAGDLAGHEHVEAEELGDLAVELARGAPGVAAPEQLAATAAAAEDARGAAVTEVVDGDRRGLGEARAEVSAVGVRGVVIDERDGAPEAPPEQGAVVALEQVREARGVVEGALGLHPGAVDGAEEVVLALDRHDAEGAGDEVGAVARHEVIDLVDRHPGEAQHFVDRAPGEARLELLAGEAILRDGGEDLSAAEQRGVGVGVLVDGEDERGARLLRHRAPRERWAGPRSARARRPGGGGAKPRRRKR